MMIAKILAEIDFEIARLKQVRDLLSTGEADGIAAAPIANVAR
jgi:hypothetical protein